MLSIGKIVNRYLIFTPIPLVDFTRKSFYQTYTHKMYQIDFTNCFHYYLQNNIKSNWIMEKQCGNFVNFPHFKNSREINLHCGKKNSIFREINFVQWYNYAGLIECWKLKQIPNFTAIVLLLKILLKAGIQFWFISEG